jgi:hypothetical protein
MRLSCGAWLALLVFVACDEVLPPYSVPGDALVIDEVIINQATARMFLTCYTVVKMIFGRDLLRRAGGVSIGVGLL